MTSSLVSTNHSYLSPDAKIFVAGHLGMVGSAIWRELELQGYSNLYGLTSKHLDLRDEQATKRVFDSIKPDVVVMAAAKVGGIVANNSDPNGFLVDNLKIQLNVFEAALQSQVPRVLFLGSSCVYPRDAAQPLTENALLTGPLEKTNDGYAIAKIAGIIQVQAIRRQYGYPYITAMPCNLYGPGDNYDPLTSHVLPALIRKFAEASFRKLPSVTLWGTGGAMREFLHVSDLARACVRILETYDSDSPINVGSGLEISIRDLAKMIADLTGFKGEIIWDPERPDGTPRKILESSRVRQLGWEPAIRLQDGIEQTIKDFKTEVGEDLK